MLRHGRSGRTRRPQSALSRMDLVRCADADTLRIGHCRNGLSPDQLAVPQQLTAVHVQWLFTANALSVDPQNSKMTKCQTFTAHSDWMRYW